MALITYILIAIPVCLLAIILWLYFNYWKYKRKNHFILLILLFYPVLSYAQYMDKTQCKISFSSHANQAGKLEYTQDGIIYRFTPESNAWKITIKNNTNKNARINWKKGSFIINGKASGISLYPFTSDDPPTDVIKEKSEITRTVTASNYNPQNHLAADNKTTCLIFPLKQKTKRLKKRSKQHTKSVIQMLFKSHLNNTFYI